MARIPPPDAVTLRARVSGWVRFILKKNRYPSVAAMARDLPYNQGSLNALVQGKGTVGLELVMKLALAGQESLDTICFRDPDPAYLHAGRAAVEAPAGVRPPSRHPDRVHEEETPSYGAAPGRKPKAAKRHPRELPQA